jgi:putative membrane protein
MEDGPEKTANELALERTDLAVQRTIMAASRTMMAWVRTGTCLISFGFTIHKILTTATEAAVASSTKLSLLHQQGPRRLGLMLIFLGITSIMMGTYEYFKTTKQLKEMSGKVYKLKGDFSLVIGALMGLLGFFLFITILTNTEVF